MSDPYNTVDPITVTGVRPPSNLGGALSGIGGLLGGILGQIGGGFRGPTPAQNAAVLQNSHDEQAALLAKYGITPPGGNTVDPITVVGPKPTTGTSTVGGSLGAGAGALTSVLSGGVNPAANPANTVDEITVEGQRPAAPNLSLASIPSSIPGLTSGTPNLPTLTPPASDPGQPLDLKTIAEGGLAGLVAPQLASGLGLTSGTPDGNFAPPDAGKSLLDQLKSGLTPTNLIGGALLGGSLLAGSGAGSGASKDAADALQRTADNASNLSNRLGDVATAGMAGDIGGRGLNSINRMVRNAQAAIRQRYAAMGMSGSTAEDDDLNAAAQAGVDQQFKIGQQMAQTGLNAIAALTGQSAAIYTSLLNAATAKDTALGNALANFAAAVVR